MSTELYVGIEDKARKVSNIYVGVEGKARKVVKAYVGDGDGKARLWWTTDVPFEVPSNCLEFVEADSNTVSGSFTISTVKNWDGTLYYNNGNGWTEWDGGEISSAELNGKQRLYFRGKGNTVIVGKLSVSDFSSYSWKMTSNYEVECNGNIETLLDYEIVANGQHPTMGDYCYSRMWYWCGLTTAPELPATELTKYCYSHLFSYTKLTAAPELPATTLASNCYNSMFASCWSLTIAPELPATTLASNCYSNMFASCWSLTIAPELPATTLANMCYYQMFANCSSLTTAPELPATTLASNCYDGMFSSTGLVKAPAIAASGDIPIEAFTTMFYNCKSLTTGPDLTKFTGTVYSGGLRNMFWKCPSLVNIPVLKITTYQEGVSVPVFKGCSSLKVSETQSDEYPTPYVMPNPLPSQGSKFEGFFEGTGGTFTGNPTPGKTYYLHTSCDTVPSSK